MDESCSVRMVQPFMRFASGHEVVKDLVAQQLFSMDLDARIPLREAHGVYCTSRRSACGTTTSV